MTVVLLNSSPLGQNGWHFAEDIFKRIFLNEKCCVSIWISMKFVPKCLIDNNWALVQVMAWYRTGDKPLPEQCWPTSRIYAALWIDEFSCSRAKHVAILLLLFSYIIIKPNITNYSVQGLCFGLSAPVKNIDFPVHIDGLVSARLQYLQCISNRNFKKFLS